jgi:hypothetical protein
LPISVNDKIEEWAEFLHLPSKTFTDFEEVRKEIIRDTELKTNYSKGRDYHEEEAS